MSGIKKADFLNHKRLWIIGGRFVLIMNMSGMKKGFFFYLITNIHGLLKADFCKF